MISVIVPVYNVEAYLCRCVDSLLRQTAVDTEIILVDDGSTDGCGALCDRYARQDPRVTTIHKPNGGLSDARNAGLEIAKGEYIAFVDSDDWVAAFFLQRLLEGLQNSGSDICECEVYHTAGAGVAAAAAPKAPICFDTESAMEQLLRNGAFRQHVWNKLYRAEVIGDIRFPVGKTNEDEFWTYQVFARAGRVCKIEDPLYNYFQRPGSIMNAGYSLKRLHGLEAKQARQRYIEENYPQLAARAGADLWLSCVYAAQMSLKYLAGDDFESARKTIDHYRCGISINCRMLSALSQGTAVWAIMSKLNFWGVCRLRNMLKRGL
ncbi:glycosyltransferase family 2 protein [Anaeromassilibacillus senegalensis]|uniref:Glycosyltransferase n=1 Tax=Anaeromassilibacillus senegalensis TaxID=1673717 RepID=A0ABS9CNQ6_9FIRM|nr:glycosyltransferase [Anaeromassilibacillus senegalensis]MCF2652694.1 glycosyltransferase [Anaeromassilibacillus senegalensis]